MTDEDYLREAIRKAQKGIADGQSPFGSVIVRAGVTDPIAVTHNTVWRDGDPTAHAEINCIRAAAKAMSTIFFNGCTLYSTAEPCPMCLAAIHWARIDRVVFGAAISDATAAGFCELRVDAKVLAQLGRSPLQVEGGLLRDECADLFQQWLKAGNVRPY